MHILSRLRDRWETVKNRKKICLSSFATMPTVRKIRLNNDVYSAEILQRNHFFPPKIILQRSDYCPQTVSGVTHTIGV